MSKYEVKTVQDPENKTTLEQKHVPHIQAPDKVKKGENFEVKVTMGKEIDHPMEEGHFIQYVALHADYYQLARTNFTHNCKAEVTFNVRLEESCTLRAFEYCNLHGQWEGQKEITVE